MKGWSLVPSSECSGDPLSSKFGTHLVTPGSFAKVLRTCRVLVSWAWVSPKESMMNSPVRQCGSPSPFPVTFSQLHLTPLLPPTRSGRLAPHVPRAARGARCLGGIDLPAALIVAEAHDASAERLEKPDATDIGSEVRTSGRGAKREGVTGIFRKGFSCSRGG